MAIKAAPSLLAAIERRSLARKWRFSAASIRTSPVGSGAALVIGGLMAWPLLPILQRAERVNQAHCYSADAEREEIA